MQNPHQVPQKSSKTHCPRQLFRLNDLSSTVLAFNSGTICPIWSAGASLTGGETVPSSRSAGSILGMVKYQCSGGGCESWVAGDFFSEEITGWANPPIK